MKKGDDAIEYNYEPKLDEDIVSTQNHLGSSEKKLGKWDIFGDFAKAKRAEKLAGLVA